jgi:hypothetical protein
MGKRKPQKRAPQGKRGAKNTKILKAVVDSESSEDFSNEETAGRRKFMEYINLHVESNEVVSPGRYFSALWINASGSLMFEVMLDPELVYCSCGQRADGWMVSCGNQICELR